MGAPVDSRSCFTSWATEADGEVDVEYGRRPRRRFGWRARFVRVPARGGDDDDDDDAEAAPAPLEDVNDLDATGPNLDSARRGRIVEARIISGFWAALIADRQAIFG